MDRTKLVLFRMELLAIRTYYLRYGSALALKPTLIVSFHSDDKSGIVSR